MKTGETIIFYPHFCRDCFATDRNPFYFGREKDVVEPCPRCGSDNVNAVFEAKNGIK